MTNPAPQPCDLLLRAAVLLTQDADGRVVRDAGVAVRGDAVAAAGPWEEVAAAHAPARTLDLGRVLLLPGLVNAHTHASMTLLRGYADDLPLMEWLHGHVWPAEARMSPELVHLGALAACAEMLASGCTCFLDGYFHEREVLRAAREAGMRVVLGEGFFGFPSPFFPTPEACWEVVEGLAEAVAGDPLARVTLMPHAAYTTTPEALRDSFALAERLDCLWHIHCAENAEETKSCLELFGQRPIPYLDSLGCLSPRTLLAHCVDVDEAETALLAARGAKVVHCPSSNMKLANGAAPVQRFLDAGIAVGLGTDGAASNNALNLFREMRHAALLQKLLTGDPTALPARTALDMATRGGASCLGWPELGSVAPGSAADFAALSLEAPNMRPLHNPVSQAVYAASGHETVWVMIGGREVFRDGRPTGFDAADLGRELEKAARWLAGRGS